MKAIKNPEGRHGKPVHRVPEEKGTDLAGASEKNDVTGAV